MAEWDLYVDESGRFSVAGEHTLIGGVLIPHEQNGGNTMFKAWENEIRNELAQSGVVTKAMLEAGDRWHLFLSKGKSGKMSATEEAEYNEIKQNPRYIFDHCCENNSNTTRWRTQEFCLNAYMKKLKAVNGFPVVFDNPQGLYHIDSNSTFMTIIANGIIRLYNHLRNLTHSESVWLYIHAASRLNVTKVKQGDLYEYSPVAGPEDVLNVELYVNQIKNSVFLNGGHALL